MIPNIGPMEVAIVLILLLVIFGPKKLPELGRSAGKSLTEFRAGLSGKHDDEEEKAAVTAPEPETAPQPTKAETV